MRICIKGTAEYLISGGPRTDLLYTVKYSVRKDYFPLQSPHLPQKKQRRNPQFDNSDLGQTDYYFIGGAFLSISVYTENIIKKLHVCNVVCGLFY
jgi:hypothetical protein